MYLAHCSEGVSGTEDYRPLHFGLAEPMEMNQEPSCFEEGRLHGDSPGGMQSQFTAHG
jgi:hypothetical protein